MGTVVGTWRLKIIIILVFMISCIYTINFIFSSSSANFLNEDGYVDYSQSNITSSATSWNDTVNSTSQGTDFMSVVFGIGDFLTFGSIDNVWARLFLSSIMAIVWIAVAYVIYTFVKEFIPFV